MSALLGLALGPSCAGGASTPSFVTDAGARTDAPSVSDDAGPGGMPDALGPALMDSGTAGRETSDIACADFLDDDGDRLTDCADTASCGALPICCVGSTTRDCCAPPTTLAPVLALAGCAGPLANCIGGAVAFGTPGPVLATTRSDGGSCLAGESMAPQGSDRSDGGAVATASLDTTVGALGLEATLGVSQTSASTLDAIAVGLTEQSDLASTASVHVRPLVAVVLSATDQTLRAVAGDVAFPTHPLAEIASPACGDLEVRIETSPAGTFDAYYRVPPSTTWVTLESARPYEPSTAAHVVAYGRSTNPGLDGVHAWVRSVSVGRTACDVIEPSRAPGAAFTTLPGTGAIRSVSRVGSRAVYEMNGSIYVAGVDASGHLQPLGRPGPTGDRILAPGEATFLASGIADPELVAIDENRRLFFTGIDAAGTRSIGYLDFDTDVLSRVTMSVPRQLVPPDAVHAVGVDGPAYFETLTPAGSGMPEVLHRWIVFRAIVDAAHSELRAVELVGSSALLGTDLETRNTVETPQFYTQASPVSPDDALYANRASVDTAFDHDEIAAPEVVAYGGVVRVFFAARRGARWSIGVLRSPDFAHFELAYPDAILSGSGSGFDAVSVSDPDVSVDASNRLTLYYTATDGTTTQPAVATQEIP